MFCVASRSTSVLTCRLWPQALDAPRQTTSNTLNDWRYFSARVEGARSGLSEHFLSKEDPGLIVYFSKSLDWLHL